MLGIGPISNDPISSLPASGSPTPQDNTGTTDSIIISGSSISLLVVDSSGLVETAIPVHGLFFSDAAMPASAFTEVYKLQSPVINENAGLVSYTNIPLNPVVSDNASTTDNVFIEGPFSNLIISETMGPTDYQIYGTSSRAATTALEVMVAPSPTIKSAVSALEVIFTGTPAVRAAATIIEVLVPANRLDWTVNQSDSAGVTDNNTSSIAHVFSQAGNDDANPTDSIASVLTREVSQQDSANPTDSDTIVLAAASGFIGWGIPLH